MQTRALRPTAHASHAQRGVHDCWPEPCDDWSWQHQCLNFRSRCLSRALQLASAWRSPSSHDTHLLRSRGLTMLWRAFLCAIGMLLLHVERTASAPESARAFLATTFGMTNDDLARI